MIDYSTQITLIEFLAGGDNGGSEFNRARLMLTL